MTQSTQARGGGAVAVRPQHKALRKWLFGTVTFLLGVAAYAGLECILPDHPGWRLISVAHAGPGEGDAAGKPEAGTGTSASDGSAEEAAGAPGDEAEASDAEDGDLGEQASDGSDASDSPDADDDDAPAAPDGPPVLAPAPIVIPGTAAGAAGAVSSSASGPGVGAASLQTAKAAFLAPLDTGLRELTPDYREPWQRRLNENGGVLRRAITEYGQAIHQAFLPGVGQAATGVEQVLVAAARQGILDGLDAAGLDQLLQRSQDPMARAYRTLERIHQRLDSIARERRFAIGRGKDSERVTRMKHRLEQMAFETAGLRTALHQNLLNAARVYRSAIAKGGPINVNRWVRLDEGNTAPVYRLTSALPGAGGVLEVWKPELADGAWVSASAVPFLGLPDNLLRSERSARPPTEGGNEPPERDGRILFSMRSVATYRLAHWLELGASVARSRLAQVQNASAGESRPRFGLLSEYLNPAGGWAEPVQTYLEPIKSTDRDAGHARTMAQRIADADAGTGSAVSKFDREAFKRSYHASNTDVTGRVQAVWRKQERRPTWVDPNEGHLQQRFSYMEVLDWLAGQGDRHMRNLFLRYPSGRPMELKLIDNDMAWGTKPASDLFTGSGAGRLPPKPPDVMDLALCVELLNPDWERRLLTELRGLLQPPEIDAFVERLRVLKDVAKRLARTPRGLAVAPVTSPARIDELRNRIDAPASSVTTWGSRPAANFPDGSYIRELNDRYETPKDGEIPLP